MIDNPGGRLRGVESASVSEVFPLLRRPHDLARKIFFWPVLATLLFGVATLGVAGETKQDPYFYPSVLCVYLCVLSTFFVYRLCGKRKSLFVLVAVAVAGLAMILMNVELYIGAGLGMLTGAPATDNTPWPLRVWKYVVRTGVSEELAKAAPVLALLVASRWIPAKGRWAGLRVAEPLDGILFATMSAASFAAAETVFQYAPKEVTDHGALAGVQVALGRSVMLVAGHVAYSGVFGYFIGLAALRRADAWKLLAIGLASAAVMHGLWDSSPSLLLSLPVGAVSYAAFGAVIVKARQISPTRADNFASWVMPSPAAAPQTVPAPISPPAAPVSPLMAPPAPREVLVAHAEPAPFQLRLAQEAIPLAVGVELAERSLPGLKARDGMAVARVTPRPDAPEVIGLQNLSAVAWTATLASGKVRTLPPDAVIRLDDGTQIAFGEVAHGVIERVVG